MLHNIFCNRCRQNLKIDFEYKEPVKSKYLENAILEIENKIAAINARTAAAPAEASFREPHLHGMRCLSC